MCVHKTVNPLFFKIALESIQRQTYRNVKIFIFCDGSLSDGHEEILNSFENRHKKYTKITRARTSVGLAMGLNIIIEQAINDCSIQFLARMDSDDISLPERFEKQVSHLEENPKTSIVGTWCIEFQQHGKWSLRKTLPTSFPEIKNFAVFRSPLIHPAVMFRRSVFDRGYRYDVNLKSMQDYELWARLIAGGYIIENIPEVLLCFRMDDNFYSRRSGLNRALVEIKMRKRYAKSMGLHAMKNYIPYLALLLLRISPAWVKKIGYRLR
jgi:glycosyltransferase involved in cell wall biosynthesis